MNSIDLDEIAIEDVSGNGGAELREVTDIRVNNKASEDYSVDSLPDHDPEEQTGGRSSPLSASFNFVNSILGAGVIGLPYAISRTGLVSGVLTLLLVNYITYFGVQTLITCGVATNRRGYESLVEYCFGRWGYITICLFMTVFAYGAMCAYLIIIGDTIPPILENNFDIVVHRNTVIGLVSVFVILPISLQKDMSMLSRTSLISVLSDLIIVLIVLVKAPGASAENPSIKKDYSFIRSTYFSGVGQMSFAFVCQHSSFIVFNTLKTPTVKVWRWVSMGSLVFVGILSLILGLSGYLSFFGTTESNILNNFPTTGEPAIDIARFLLAVTMLLTYPMELFVARHALNNVLFGDPSVMYIPTSRHIAITLGLWLAALIVGLTFTDLGFVFEFVGAFSGSMIGYVLPAACYLKVLKMNKHAIDHVYSGLTAPNEAVPVSSRFLDWNYFGVCFMLVFGILAMILGSISAIQYK